MIPTYASQSYVSMNVGGCLDFPTAYRQEPLLSIVWLWDSMVSLSTREQPSTTINWLIDVQPSFECLDRFPAQRD